MRTNITALQTASTLQTYPAAISQQLNSLRDRLEARAYSGQALSDLKGDRRASTTTSNSSARVARSSRRSSIKRCCCGTSTGRWSIRW